MMDPCPLRSGTIDLEQVQLGFESAWKKGEIGADLKRYARELEIANGLGHGDYAPVPPDAATRF